MTLESPILNLAEFLGKEVIILLRNGPTQAGVIIPSSIELLPWGWMTGLYPYSIDSAPALTWTGPDVQMPPPPEPTPRMQAVPAYWG
jgi:hypothetical protein